MPAVVFQGRDDLTQKSLVRKTTGYFTSLQGFYQWKCPNLGTSLQRKPNWLIFVEVKLVLFPFKASNAQRIWETQQDEDPNKQLASR